MIDYSTNRPDNTKQKLTELRDGKYNTIKYFILMMKMKEEICYIRGIF